MRTLVAFFFIFILAGCNKPDPQPQLKDPIYNDLKRTVGALDGLIEAEKKALEGFEKELAEVIPQTGQIKYAQKRVHESKAKLVQLQQEKMYFELKAEAQERASRKSYLKAFKNGEPWPNNDEWNAYQAEKRLRLAKKTWDVKERMKDLGLGSEMTPEPAQKGH